MSLQWKPPGSDIFTDIPTKYLETELRVGGGPINAKVADGAKPAECKLEIVDGSDSDFTFRVKSNSDNGPTSTTDDNYEAEIYFCPDFKCDDATRVTLEHAFTGFEYNMAESSYAGTFMPERSGQHQVVVTMTNALTDLDPHLSTDCTDFEKIFFVIDGSIDLSQTTVE